MYGLIEYHEDNSDVIDVPVGRCRYCKKQFYVVYGVCLEYHMHMCKKKKNIKKKFNLREFFRFCIARDYYMPRFLSGSTSSCDSTTTSTTTTSSEQYLECPKCQKKYDTQDPEGFLSHADSCTFE